MKKKEKVSHVLGPCNTQHKVGVAARKANLELRWQNYNVWWAVWTVVEKIV